MRPFSNLSILLPDGSLLPGTVSVAGGTITAITPETNTAAATFDCGGLTALPGLIDVHIQGAAGACVMDADTGGLSTICRAMARFGTTGLLATPIPDPANGYRNLKVIGETFSTTGGSAVLGVHLEGPFLNPGYTGAFTGKEFAVPSIDALNAFIHACAPAPVMMMSIAPELAGSMDVIDALVGRGILPSLGHTDADYVTAAGAITRGTVHVTHMFNAMRPFHHREPGIIGAVLSDDRVSMQIVPDGYHLHPGTLKMLTETVHPERLILITDAMRCACLPDGRTYISFGKEITVKNGKVTLADGTIAGSALTMDAAVRNMMRFTGISMAQAVNMASLNPARVLGLDDRKGKLTAGYDADMILVDDDMHVHLTMVAGKVVFSDVAGIPAIRH